MLRDRAGLSLVDWKTSLCFAFESNILSVTWGVWAGLRKKGNLAVIKHITKQWSWGLWKKLLSIRSEVKSRYISCFVPERPPKYIQSAVTINIKPTTQVIIVERFLWNTLNLTNPIIDLCSSFLWISWAFTTPANDHKYMTLMDAFRSGIQRDLPAHLSLSWTDCWDAQGYRFPITSL